MAESVRLVGGCLYVSMWKFVSTICTSLLFVYYFKVLASNSLIYLTCIMPVLKVCPLAFPANRFQIKG